MVFARFSGSLMSSGSGRPWPTSQNGQRRVHLSPLIMKGAVAFAEQSAMFGQDASSQTVTRLLARRMSLISLKRLEGNAALTRIQSGFGSFSAGMTLIGIHAVLPAPFCLSIGLRSDVDAAVDSVAESAGVKEAVVSVVMAFVVWCCRLRRRSSCESVHQFVRKQRLHVGHCRSHAQCFHVDRCQAGIAAWINPCKRL